MPPVSHEIISSSIKHGKFTILNLRVRILYTAHPTSRMQGLSKNSKFSLTIFQAGSSHGRADIGRSRAVDSNCPDVIEASFFGKEKTNKKELSKQACRSKRCQPLGMGFPLRNQPRQRAGPVPIANFTRSNFEGSLLDWINGKKSSTVYLSQIDAICLSAYSKV